MGFDLHQLLPKHESGKKVDFAGRVLLFVWAFPIVTVYACCQIMQMANSGSKSHRTLENNFLVHKIKSPVQRFSVPYVSKIHLQTNIKECQNT